MKQKPQLSKQKISFGNNKRIYIGLSYFLIILKQETKIKHSFCNTACGRTTHLLLMILFILYK